MGITVDRPSDVTGDKIIIEGGTDGTSIGNVADALKVTIGAGASSGVAAYSAKLRYEDMNASTGGVARSTSIGTSYTDLFSYSGSGVFAGFRINCQTLSDWSFQLIIDGNNIYNADGAGGILMADFIGNALYGFGDLDNNWGGLFRSSNIFVHNDFTKIVYTTSVVIKAKNPGGKKFLAGIVAIQKDT